MRNQLKKWFAVLMAMVLGMPGYGLSIKNITTKAENESITIYVENEERHVQTGETVALLDGVSVEGSGEESYRAVVGDVQEQDAVYLFMKKEWKNLLFQRMRQVKPIVYFIKHKAVLTMKYGMMWREVRKKHCSSWMEAMKK